MQSNIIGSTGGLEERVRKLRATREHEWRHLRGWKRILCRCKIEFWATIQALKEKQDLNKL
jgi:hypothetical protein